MSALVSSSRAFNGVAPAYDSDFTETSLGRELRSRVWERLSRTFTEGEHVLELNCGTGEDACYLAARGVRVTATDGSRAMLDVARSKAASRGLSHRIRFAKLDLERPELEGTPGVGFDGVISNFGGLNCVEDLAPLASKLRGWLRPEAKLVLVEMGPLCLWESAFAIAGGAPKRAFRRWAKSASARIGDERIRVSYRWPSETAEALGEGFVLTRVEGLGVFLPPSLWSRSMESRPHLLRALRGAEWCFRGVWPFRHLGDHHVVELQWKSGGR